MADDGAEAYPGINDRIVAEFGDGHDVESIAARYGLTAEQVYAIVQNEVRPAEPPSPYPPAAYYPPPPQGYYAPQPPPGYYPPQPPPGYYPPQPPPGYYPPQPPPGYYAPPPAPGYYAPQPAYPPPVYTPPPAYQPSPEEEAIVAAYADGHDVATIAHDHGFSVRRVYKILQRVLGVDPQSVDPWP